MARKKKSMSQSVVGVATTGMPSPVRKFLGARWIALLIVVAVPILFATGIVSVRMENGRPKVTFNQQRAAEVREDAVDKAQDLRREHVGRDTPVADFAQGIGIGKDDTVAEQIQDAVGEGYDNAADGFGDMAEGVSENFEQARQIDFGVEEEKSGFHPFSKLKEKTEGLLR